MKDINFGDLTLENRIALQVVRDGILGVEARAALLELEKGNEYPSLVSFGGGAPTGVSTIFYVDTTTPRLYVRTVKDPLTYKFVNLL